MSQDRLQSDNRRAVPADGTVEPPTISRSLVEPGETAGAPPHGTLSAERLREVLRRLNSNFYDRADVRDEIALRVARELASAATVSRAS